MSHTTKKIAIIGATSAIAEHCARLWAAEADAELHLVARNADKAERIAADLRVRQPHCRVVVHGTDFIDPAAIQHIVGRLVADGPLHSALIAHGALPDQTRCQESLADCQQALTVNALSPVLFAEALAGHMQQAGYGTLAIIGSVAGDRGRKSNYVYGAAKGLVTRYAQGLQHRLAYSGVKVVLVKPGPTATPMTAHLPSGGMARVEAVAADIVKGMQRGRAVIYTPRKWALIMLIIRHLPRAVFNRMDV